MEPLVARLNSGSSGVKYDKRTLQALVAGLHQFQEDALGVNVSSLVCTAAQEDSSCVQGGLCFCAVAVASMCSTPSKGGTRAAQPAPLPTVYWLWHAGYAPSLARPHTSEP